MEMKQPNNRDRKKKKKKKKKEKDLIKEIVMRKEIIV